MKKQKQAEKARNKYIIITSIPQSVYKQNTITLANIVSFLKLVDA